MFILAPMPKPKDEMDLGKKKKLEKIQSFIDAIKILFHVAP